MGVDASLNERAAGVLLHVTSLPGRHGSGDLGAESRAFVDLLAAGRQRWWQMLPVGPIGHGGVPYASPSSLAGNPLLIDLDALIDAGLLTQKQARPPRRASADKVNFPTVIKHRMRCLRQAHETFDDDTALAKFAKNNSDWLDDYALFEALREAHGRKSWIDWPRDLALRKPAALARAAERHADAIRFHVFCQYLFARQWDALRNYASKRGVKLIGDVPIYVDHNSVDVWAHRKLFELDRDGHRKVVAGVPPDQFNRRGQVWGSPLYRWDEHLAERFDWWTRRFAVTMRRFDVVRIDHFLGFERSFAIPAGDRTAKRGRWRKAPGRALLAALRRRLGHHLPLIAEDLGVMTEQAAALRDRFEIPGMRIVQWGFDGDAYHLPHQHVRRCVAYTGTHDCDTTMGWFDQLPAKRRRFVRAYVRNRHRKTLADDLVAAVYASPANLAIIPLQDLLGLGTDARMNRPGTKHGNWRWRVRRSALSDDLAKKLRELTTVYQRHIEGPAG